MKLELLTRATGWYGRHSGYYEQLPGCLARSGVELRVTRAVDSPLRRAAGKAIALARRLPARNQSLAFAEEQFRWRLHRDGAPGHVLAFESHLPLFRAGRVPSDRLAATVHLPPSLLDDTARATLRLLPAALVLYRRDLDFLGGHVPGGRVKFVRHGVDTDFFRPAEKLPVGDPRLLYVGQFGRDTAQMARVAPRLLELVPALHIDIVLASAAFRERVLEPLLTHSRIAWHYGVPDVTLLALYQRAHALLLPMRASGANNAILEALACGLPIVTNDVGGIRDYGGGTLFELAPAGNDDAIVDLAHHWLGHEPARREASARLRAFAATELTWERSASDHLQAYRELFG